MSCRRGYLPAATVLAISLTAALLAAAAAPAGAATPMVPVGAFAQQMADGQPVHARRIAVNHATGDVYRADTLGNRIVVYRPSGDTASELTSFGAGELSAPFGVAIDQATGDVYVSDAGNGRIVRYQGDGAEVPTFTRDLTYPGPPSGPGEGAVGDFAAPIALDPTDGALLVADRGDNLVERFDSAGSALAAFDAPWDFTGLQDVAVDSTGDVLTIDATGDPAVGGVDTRVDRFSSSGTWEASIGSVYGAATLAVRPATDEVIVSGNQDAVSRNEKPTIASFEPDGTLGWEFPVSDPALYSSIAGIASDDGPDGRLYVATDAGIPFGAFYGLVSVQVYAAAVPPTAATSPPTPVTAAAATLRASVNTGGLPATYRFEYGTDDSYGSSTADLPIEGSFGDQDVSVPVAGLEPQTTYHYRVVVDSALGDPVASADATFTTADPPATDLTASSATLIAPDQVQLRGSVDTNGKAGVARFALVRADGHPYAATTDEVPLAAVDGIQDVAAIAGDLPPGASFRVRLTVVTSGGPRHSDELSFSTPAGPGYSPAPRDRPSDSPYGCDGFLTRPAWLACAGVLGDESAPPAGTGALRVATRVTGAVARFTVRVPAAGSVSVRGRLLSGASKRPRGASKVALRVRLTKEGRAALRRAPSGRLRVRATIRFRASNGATRKTVRTILFERKDDNR